MFYKFSFYEDLKQFTLICMYFILENVINLVFIMYTQRTLIRVKRASSVLKFCIPIGQFQCKVNGYTRIDQWGYRILKLRGHVRHESMSTGCT